jgi:hypothetical protein
MLNGKFKFAHGVAERGKLGRRLSNATLTEHEAPQLCQVRVTWTERVDKRGTHTYGVQSRGR